MRWWPISTKGFRKSQGTDAKKIVLGSIKNAFVVIPDSTVSFVTISEKFC